jgi:hypothetical protein
MLKGVVSNFIVLIKLPRHVSTSKCHLQRGYSFLASYSSFSLRFGWMWAIIRLVWPSAAECHTKRTIAHISGVPRGGSTPPPAPSEIPKF